MAKKKRSAKQKRNDARLGRMAKSRARKSTPKRRSSKPKRRKSRRKVNKPRKRSKSVAKKRAPSKKRSFTSKIPLVNNPTVRKVATGIGLATIGTTVIAIVAPSIAANPIVKPALAFIGGGLAGLIGQVVVGGGLGSFGNIFGGSNGNGGQAAAAGSGFA